MTKSGGRRLLHHVLALGLLAAGAWGLSRAPTAGAPDQAGPSAKTEPSLHAHARQAQAAELRQRFDQAVLMLHARQYEHAAVALQRVLQLSPGLPEAHVNLGFALIGLQRGAEAAAAFDRAIDLRPRQANAYYGLAMALEQQGDLQRALGAMRSYLHLSTPDARYHAKARAALWEWEQRLGRHRPESVVRRP